MNQQKHFTLNKKHSGFSLVELLIVIAVIGITATVSTPGVMRWLPNYKLKSAARDLYSTLQRARLMAVKRNANVRLVFDNTVTPGFYFIDIDNSGTINQPGESRTDLSGYGYGIDFGFPAGLVDWSGNGVPSSVTFPGGPPPRCTYSSNGTTGNGTVYLINTQQHIVYAVTTVISGAIKLRKYNGITPYNQNNWIH